MLRAVKSSALCVLLLANSRGIWSFTATSFRLTWMGLCVYTMRMGLVSRIAMAENWNIILEGVPQFLTMFASIAVLFCASGLPSRSIQSGRTSNITVPGHEVLNFLTEIMKFHVCGLSMYLALSPQFFMFLITVLRVRLGFNWRR
jgi:hypothetical protein